MRARVQKYENRLLSLSPGDKMLTRTCPALDPAVRMWGGGGGWGGLERSLNPVAR